MKGEREPESKEIEDINNTENKEQRNDAMEPLPVDGNQSNDNGEEMDVDAEDNKNGIDPNENQMENMSMNMNISNLNGNIENETNLKQNQVPQCQKWRKYQPML